MPWIIRITIFIVFLVAAVGIHTQAPLVTLDCPINKETTNREATPENCASVDVLLIRSWTDLWRGTEKLFRHYRDDITAVSTLAVAFFTGTLWWVTWGMVRIAKAQQPDTLRAIKAAEKAAKAARDTVRAMRESERPWIKVDANIESDLTFTERRRAQITIKFTLLNVGKTPALHTAVHARFFSTCAFGPNGQVFRQADMEIHELIEVHAPKGPWAGTIHGMVIFPNDRGYYGNILDTAIDGEPPKYGRSPVPSGTPWNEGRTIENLMIAGVVLYESGAPGGQFQTPFMFEICSATEKFGRRRNILPTTIGAIPQIDLAIYIPLISTSQWK